MSVIDNSKRVTWLSMRYERGKWSTVQLGRISFYTCTAEISTPKKLMLHDHDKKYQHNGKTGRPTKLVVAIHAVSER